MKIYLVGGAVRDELLGLPVTERDYVVVGATERQMLDRGFRRLDVAFPVFLHPDTGDEYALARRERKIGPGYKGFAVDAGPDVTLEQDLVRRDLTVNALARDESGEIVDLFQGRDDLDEGLLRHISPAFEEDPVRLLRAARFVARFGHFGFRLSHKTFGLMKRMARRDELLTVYPDRLREEMLKSLASPQPWRFFETLNRCGALAPLLPEVADAMDVGPSHGAAAESRPVAALRRCAALSQEASLRFAVLAAAVCNDADEAGRFGRGLVLDRNSRDTAQWLLNWPASAMVAGDARRLLGMLEDLKLGHHPERLDRLALGWAALEPDIASAAENRARGAKAAADSVRAGDLAAAGLRGPALGDALRERRLHAIEATLG